MSMPISGSLPIRTELPSIDSSRAVRPGSFSDVLQSAVDRVEISSKTANQSVQDFLAGDTEDLHTVGIASQKADLEFEMFLQVRNKVVQAYQEIMRMQM